MKWGMCAAMTNLIYAIRVCSPQKNMAGRTLNTVYINPMLQSFFRIMERQQIPYAILSRKYGICVDTERYVPYPDCEMLSDAALLERLIAQKPRFGKTKFLYWNHRPITHQKWVALLRTAGYDVEEYRTLDALIVGYIECKYNWQWD